jgi:putative colanic acid biosynthesis UDP-glucose lipid carrier transferase
MQKSSYPFYRSLLWLADWVALIFVFVFVNSLFPSIDAFRQRPYIHLFYVWNLTWMASVYVTALYQSRHWLEFNPFLKISAKTYLLSAFMIFVFVFMYKYSYSRLFVFTAVCMFGFMILLNRIFFHFVILAASNGFAKKVALIGWNETASKLTGFLKGDTRLVKMMGYFDDGPAMEPAVPVDVKVHMAEGKQSDGARYYFNRGNSLTFSGSIQNFLSGFISDGYDKEYVQPHTAGPKASYLGRLEECLDFAIEHNVEEIYCTISPEVHPELYVLAQEAERNFIHFKFVPDYSHFALKSTLVDYIGDLPLLSLRRLPLEDISNRILKRSFDVVMSLAVTIFILSWLIPVLALLIKLDSKGPVFFTQQRSGRNNRPFWCIKFRTLRSNAESEAKQVTKNDDRVTKLGRILRKTNIDELPQFLNVLIGHMSVVGPRPHMLRHTREFDKLHDEYMIRHFVKPGVTGLAQVSGYRGEIRNPELLRKRVEHDIRYIENWSMMEDVRIIAATVFLSFRGDENAY